MSFKNSRDNLIVNIAQQTVGLVLVVAVPFFLSVDVIEEINNIEKMSQAGIDNVTVKGINNIIKEVLKLAL